MKQYWILITLIALINTATFATEINKQLLRSGDLLFQNIECGSMCDAIREVTQGYEGRGFSHVAMVVQTGKEVYVIEAVAAGVKQTRLDSFLLRSHDNVLVGRLKKPYRSLTKKAVLFSLQQQGIPYDDAFLYDNGKYYCSELVYDAYLYANGGKPFFELAPMTFKQPGSEQYYPVWVDYFDSKGQDIPEGQPGCNPGGLSLSDKIDILGNLAPAP